MPAEPTRPSVRKGAGGTRILCVFVSGRRLPALVALLVALTLASLTANAAVPGDLNQDCSVGTADALLLWSAVTGATELNAEQEDAADIAPVVGGTSAPDGFVNLADLAVLLRAIAGLQALPGGVNVPKLDTLPEETVAGYVNVTGTACAGDVVKLYVKTKLRGTATAGADGSFSFPLLGMAYGANDFKATATAAGQTSGNSEEQTVDNDQTVITWDNPALTGDITVWPPPPEGHYKVSSDFPVPSGKTLILPPGTIVEFVPGGSLEVDGRLLVQGATGAAVTLRKASTGRWDGILIETGQGTLLQSALILGANYPIKVTGANTAATLRGSELYDFLDGVSASAGASVIVDGTWIHYGSTTGTGIRITNADLTITNSHLENLAMGVDVSGSSFATIGPGNEFETFRDAAIQIVGPADGLIVANEIDVSATPSIGRAQWGINLLNSSPEIRGNEIYGAETGIRVAGGSNPLITDGNDIHSNIWGIWLEGDTDVDSQQADDKVGNPIPIITNNSIHDNSGPKPTGTQRSYCSSQGANLCISDVPPGSNVVVDARGNFWGNNNPEMIRSPNSIINPDVSTIGTGNNTQYVNSLSDPVAIDLSNFASSSTSGPGTTPLFLNPMTGISHSPSLMAPTLGGVLGINFSLVTPADVTLRIYKENTTFPEVRVITMPGLGAGPHTIPWDGKDGDGNFVTDEAYTYALSTSVAGFTDVFNPARPPELNKLVHLDLTHGSTSFPSGYNVYRNEPLKILFDVERARGRVRVNQVFGASPPTIINLANFWPFPEMFRQLFVYDGFGPSGDLFVGPATYFFHPDPIQRNAVIVERTTPLIAGPDYESVRHAPPAIGPTDVPKIEVKGDPYLVRLSYDQISRIAFCIDQPAYLTVKILRPGRGDPTVGADVVATLLQDTTTPHGAVDCAGGASPYVVEWNGTEASSADPHLLRPVADGAYTFTIEARNAVPTGQTNLRSIYRGIVQTRQ